MDATMAAMQNIESRLSRLNDTVDRLEAICDRLAQMAENNTSFKSRPVPPPVAFTTYDAFILQIPSFITMDDISATFTLPSCHAVIQYLMKQIFSHDRLGGDLWFPMYIPKKSRTLWIATETDAKERTSWAHASHINMVKLVHAIYIAVVDLLDAWRRTHTTAADVEQYDITMRKLLDISYGPTDAIFVKLRKDIKTFVTV